jgi:nitroreductase
MINALSPSLWRKFAMEIDTVDPVISRRSIRKFTEKPLKESLVRRILNAAMCAPSADDERPWHFIVIRDIAVKGALSEVWPLAHIIKNAPLAIVVCGDEALHKRHDCWMLDCSAAVQNILIEAQYLGLGAVWLGVYPVEERIKIVRDILGVPKSITPFAIIPIGHPNESKERFSRFNEDRVHREKWL